MKAKHSIENLVRELDIRIDPRVDQRILDNTLGRFRESAEKPPADSRPMSWRKIMKTPIAKLTIAAAVVVAALLVIHFFSGTSTTAWAAVLEKVMTFDTYVYRSREVETTGPRPDGFEFATERETTVYHSQMYGFLDEVQRNEKLFARYYWLLQTNEYVGICYGLEEYERLPLKAGWMANPQSRDPRQMIVQVLEGNCVPLGRDTIAGRVVEGVQMHDPNVLHYLPAKLDDFTAQVWIDVETELPVWVEISYVERGSTLRSTTVIDRFQWGVPLDPALFEPNIPAHFALDYTDKPRPDSVPKTDPAKAFAENTQGEPYLGDFDHLELPDVTHLALLGVDVNVPGSELRLLTADEIWMTQDQFMAQWPPYDQVEGQLRQELHNKLGISQLGVDELVTTGVALRERFWKLGGCLSEVSYPYAYAARIVTEMAHDETPDDLNVTDQFIESIITYEISWIHHPDPNERIKNPVYPGRLTGLRAEQFEQLKRGVAEGQAPTWKDFVRVQDLILLLNTRLDDYAGALEATQWLITQSETAGWTYYVEQLERMERAFAAGNRMVVGVFLESPDAFPEEFRYARRLFSFQGPRKRSRELLPVHLRHLKGW